MPTYDLAAYVPSLKEPQHKTYLGNTSRYIGYLDQATAVGAATGTSGDTVVVPLITLPHGALIDKWELKWSAFGASNVLNLGFRYVNPAAAAANPRYGVSGQGMPTASATQFKSSLDVSSAGTTSDIFFLSTSGCTPFLCQADVQIIATISGGSTIVPANAQIALILSGRNKGAL